MTPNEAKKIAQEAADQAVKRTFTALGLDIADGEAVIEAQKDFAHVRRHRQTCEMVQRQSIKVTVGIVVTSAVAAVIAFLGFKGLAK